MNEGFDTVIDKLSLELSKDNNSSRIAESLIEYELAVYEPETARLQHGIANFTGKLEEICSIRNSIIPDATAQSVENQIKTYEMLKDNFNHRQRRYRLEKMIRLLRPICNDEAYSNSNLLLLLAKVWLYRSQLFRPRGFSTPARKIEALKNAMNLSLEVLNSDKKNVMAWRIWSLSALDLNSLRDDSFKISSEMLKDASTIIIKDGVDELNDFRIILESAEQNKSTVFLEELISEEENWDRKCDLFLFKARAAFMMERPEEAIRYLNSTIEYAPEALSDPFWEEFVDFLTKLKTKDHKGWRDIALKAYKLCNGRELNVGNNVYLSWHWSRQKSFYDLAFMAANNEQKAEVADSVKSRPLLRYQVLHEMKNIIPGIDNVLTQEDEQRDGRYLKKPPRAIRRKNRNPPRMDLLPDPWFSVHLFLNDIEDDSGHAMIYSKRTGWLDPLPFNGKKLFEEYLSWQEVYHLKQSMSNDKAMALVSLCRVIGETMPFLFNNDILPKETPVLWIPHGFLHRIPLHSAIREGSNEVFLENHASKYLPAWNFFSNKHLGKGQGRRLLTYIPEDEDEFEEVTEITWDEYLSNADANELKKAIDLNPEILAIICHGHGDVINPFRSWLQLKNSGVSILDLLKYSAKLNGSRIMLGACESDMAPPMNQPVDEHISLSTIFLSHGASEVLAGLWDVGMTQVDELYSEIRDVKNLSDALRIWQRDEVKQWRNTEDSGKRNDLIFYDLAPFRITGFNVPAQDKGASE